MSGAIPDASDRGDRVDETPERTINELIDPVLAARGDNPAVCFGDKVLTYQELDHLASSVATGLSTRGIGVGARVGIALDRSIELIAGIIGVLRSGAAYVPLDPNYPPDRVRRMSELARLQGLITDPDAAHLFPNCDLLFWDDLDNAADEQAEALSTQPATPPAPGDDAYVIFTSGSTGEPKGVQLPHRALANLVEWQLNRPSFHHGARVLQYTSVSFDVSFQEIATTLASGGQLFLIDDATRRDPKLLLDVLINQRIERLFLPFVALRSLVDVAVHTGRFPTALSEVITAGEQLRVDDTLRKFFREIAPGATLDNQYGPSESHVITAHLLVGDPDSWPALPPIGRPITNNCVYVLDEQLKPVERGTAGELFLSGRNLAHGYLDREDLTSNVFTRHPDLDERVYRTGDIVAEDEDGTIRYLGRSDGQVKIRGHRVEPEEINVVASRLPGVGQCATTAFHHPNGTAFLCTYIVASPGSTLNVGDIRNSLRDALPEYLTPAFVFTLDELPMGASGKAELRRLPRPEELLAKRTVSFDDEVEQSIAAIFSDVLGFPGLDRESNFFDVGGDSLGAVTVFLRIEDEFGTDLPLATLAKAPTVRQLAAAVREAKGQAAVASSANRRSIIELREGAPGVTPLFLVHGGKGNVLHFREFAERLDPTQPIYAFQWPGWDGGRGPRRVDAMADAYLRELREVRPHGPYRLGGHCIGGLVAIELAERLRSEGEEIDAPLIISDTPNLSAHSYHRSEPEQNPGHLAAFEDMVQRLHEAARRDTPQPTPPVQDSGSGSHSSPLPRNRIYRLPTVGPLLLKLRRSAAIRWLEVHTANAVWRARVEVALARRRRIPTDHRERYCQASMVSAARRHRSTGTDLPVLYFRTFMTKGREMRLRGWWDDVYLGFPELCRGGLEVHVVGGGHNDALSFPFAAERAGTVFQASQSVTDPVHPAD